MAAPDDDPRAPGQLGALLRQMARDTDVEPPARGLDALLAAAAARRPAPAPPSLWQRLAAVFARPAVLALAGLLVVVGVGGVLWSRGGNKVAEPMAASAAGSAAATANAAARDKPEAEHAAPAADAPPPTFGAASATASAQETDADRQAKLATAEGSRKRRAAPPTIVTDESTGGIGGQDDGAATGAGLGTADAYALPPADRPLSAQARANAASAEASALLRAARAAVSRGACPDAKVLVTRARAIDATAARDALAADKALAACVASP